MTEYMGYDGFVWFFGVVEDRNDPLQLGRVRVRPFTEYSGLETDELPWARVLVPATSSSKLGVGVTPLGLEIGSVVFGFYADAQQMQFPMILGAIHAIPEKTGGDDFNPEYDLSKHGVSELARGTNRITKNLLSQEPASQYAAAYPYNKVIQTESGHVIEIDDTPDQERLHVYHKSGSYIEISKDGRAVYKSVGNTYQITAGDHIMQVAGDVNITVEGDTNITTTGTTNITSEGETIVNSESGTTINSSGDTLVTSNGKTTVNSGGSTVVTSAAAVTVKGSSVAVQGTTIAVTASSIKLQASSVKIQSGGIGFSSKPSIGGLGGFVSAVQTSIEVAKSLGYNRLDSLVSGIQSLSAFGSVAPLATAFDAVYSATPLKSLSDISGMVTGAVENISGFADIGDLGTLTLQMTDIIKVPNISTDIIRQAEDFINVIDQVVKNGFPSLNDFNDVVSLVERGLGSVENITKMAKIGELLNTVAYASDIYTEIQNLADGGITASDFKNLIGITSGDLADFIDDIASGAYVIDSMVDDFSNLELGLGGVNDIYTVSGYLSTLQDNYSTLAEFIPTS